MLQPQQLLGDFHIIRLLGKGGMGEVYEAEQSQPKRRVALKVLAPWLAANDQALQRFWREANVPAQLDHPGIVRIFSTGKTANDVAYYTMHLVRGISLAQLLKLTQELPLTSTKPMGKVHEATPTGGAAPDPEEQPAGGDEGGLPPMAADYMSDRFQTLARIGAMAGRVLASAHQKDFLHRDIKPSNLMIDHYDHLYLVDFGLTRSLAADSSETGCGQVIGTPWYMSPEQARGETLDARSDIYSLGITLYELATGGIGPFTADRGNNSAVLEQVKTGTQLPLRTLVPNIPPALERIINHCVHPRPQRRYGSALELALDLEKFLQDKPVSTKPRRWFAEDFPWKKLGIGAAAVVAAAVLLVVGGLWQSGAGPHDQGQAAVDPQLDDNGKPYPDLLRKRQWRLRTHLMLDNFDLLWCRRLQGTGWYQPNPVFSSLWVEGPATDSTPTFLALDDDPRRRWFEFSVKFQPTAGDKTGRTGIFFGYPARQSDAEPMVHFFLVEVDEHPKEHLPNGQVIIGTQRLSPKKGLRATYMSALARLPGKKGSIALDRSAAWAPHEVTVKVINNVITVSANRKNAEPFDMDWLNKEFPATAGSLNPLGALGIWVAGGRGHFSEATITAYPGSDQ